MIIYSAIGPSAIAGRKLKAPINSMTNVNIKMNNPLFVDNVPTVAAIFFFELGYLQSLMHKEWEQNEQIPSINLRLHL